MRDIAAEAEIKHEAERDIGGIRRVNEEAFGQAVEADIVDALRDTDALTLSLVAVIDKLIVGHVAFSPVTIESDDEKSGAIGLAPMAVLPEYQNRGIGSRLVMSGLEELRKLGHEIVVVLGHPEYYPRFGFAPSKPFGITWEHEVPEEAFMILELKEGALRSRQGIARFHQVFKGV